MWATPRGFFGTVVDESDTSQTPEKRSCSLVPLLNGSSHFIYLFPISPSILTCSPRTNRTVFKTPLLSFIALFLSRVYFPSSVRASICVFHRAFVSVSVYGFHYSFSDTTHLSETGFHMIIQKALFSSIVQSVLMYGKRHAEQM